jgi:hypothetical protein
LLDVLMHRPKFLLERDLTLDILPRWRALKLDVALRHEALGSHRVLVHRLLILLQGGLDVADDADVALGRSELLLRRIRNVDDVRVGDLHDTVLLTDLGIVLQGAVLRL